MFARRWLTLTGSFIARSSLAVVRIHTDSAASAWLSRVSVTEAPSVTTNPFLNAVGDGGRHKGGSSGENGCGSAGCVRQGIVDGGWSLHGMDVEWTDMAGKTDVAYLIDAGMLSDMFQSFPTVPGNEYRVEYEVYVPEGETFDCRIPKTGCWGSGSLDIHDGEHCDIEDYNTWDQQASEGNYGTTQAGSSNTCFTEQSDILYLNPLISGQWLTLSGSFVAPSRLAVVRIHTDSAASASVARVSIKPSPNQVMNPMLLPREEGTFNREQTQVGGHEAGAGELAGDWQVHNAIVSYGSIGGRVDVVHMEDNGALSDLWQPFPTEPGRVYNVVFEVYVAAEDLLPCTIESRREAECWGNGMLDIHDGTVCDIADYDAFEAGGVDAGVAPGACDHEPTLAGPYICSPNCCTCFQSISEELLLNPTVGDEWVTLTGSFTAPSALAIVRVHTEGAAAAYIRRVEVAKAPDMIMNPMLLPNGVGTFAHEGATASNFGGSGGVLAGDWQLHNLRMDYASIGGRVDVLYLQDNGPLSDMWQPFPTEPGTLYNVIFEVYVAAADLLDCTVEGEDPQHRVEQGCFGNGALDIHDGTVCDLAQYDVWETTEVGAHCDHCAAPDWVGCVAGDYQCSPHCCTCFSYVSLPAHSPYGSRLCLATQYN